MPECMPAAQDWLIVMQLAYVKFSKSSEQVHMSFCRCAVKECEIIIEGAEVFLQAPCNNAIEGQKQSRPNQNQ